MNEETTIQQEAKKCESTFLRDILIATVVGVISTIAVNLILQNLKLKK